MGTGLSTHLSLHPARPGSRASDHWRVGVKEDRGNPKGKAGFGMSWLAGWLAVQRSLGVLTVMETIVQTAEVTRRWVIYSDKPAGRKRVSLEHRTRRDLINITCIYTIYDLASRSRIGHTSSFNFTFGIDRYSVDKSQPSLNLNNIHQPHLSYPRRTHDHETTRTSSQAFQRLLSLLAYPHRTCMYPSSLRPQTSQPAGSPNTHPDMQ